MNGLDTAANGAARIDQGARQLDTGLRQLSSGAHELADQLKQGRDQIPVYDQAQRDRLGDVASTPAVALTDNTDLGAAVAAVGLTLALWACALSTYIVTPALPSVVLTSRHATRRIVVRAALPGAMVALLAALILGLVLMPLLHLSLTRWLALIGVTALAALSFVALNQAAVAIFDRAGRFASIAVLVIAIVTSLTSTIPATLHTIGTALPTHAATLALRGVIIGSDTISTGLAQLIAWLLAAAVATLLITEHRRTLDSKQLRLGFGSPLPS